MDTRYWLVAILSFKAFLVVVILVIPKWMPEFQHEWLLRGAPSVNYQEPPAYPERHFLTWDSYHYVNLASAGYQPEQTSNAFFPLWPACIKVVASIIRAPAVWVGTVLANLLSLLAFGLLHRYLSARTAPEVANYSVAFLVLYPGSVFYLFSYSEALFLLLCVLFFVLLEQKKEYFAALVALLLPLTRGLGAFIVLPILYVVYQKKSRGEPVGFSGWALVLAPLAGVLVYLGWMHVALGDAFAGLSAQNLFAFPESQKRALMHLIEFREFFQNFITVRSFHEYFYSAMDRALFVSFLICLPILWKRERVFFFFALGLGLFPVLTGSFMSYARYLAVVFPVFYALATIFEHKKAYGMRWGLLALFLVMHTYFAIRHAVHFWVG